MLKTKPNLIHTHTKKKSFNNGFILFLPTFLYEFYTQITQTTQNC